MSSIKLENISKYVCKNVNLEIFNKELLVLLDRMEQEKALY